MALEQKVLQTVELIKKEREARTQAESARYQAETDRDTALAEAADLRKKLAAADEKLTAAGDAQAEIANLQRERTAVRQRVEKMLATMDSLLWSRSFRRSIYRNAAGNRSREIAAGKYGPGSRGRRRGDLRPGLPAPRH